MQLSNNNAKGINKAEVHRYSDVLKPNKTDNKTFLCFSKDSRYKKNTFKNNKTPTFKCSFQFK